jgi:L-aspartate oxidase
LNGPADSDPSPLSTDVAVVGGGAAGLYVALRAAEHGASVTLVSRKPLSQTASYWAQGGLAAALAPDDSPARHAQDTLNAGRGLCRSTAVDVLTREAPAAVAELIQLGVRFDPEPGSGQGSSASPTPGLALALEG